jgi:hypothetical protein
MSEYITDPELLAKLEGKKKSADKGYVTDPKILAELNKGSEPESALQTFGRSTASMADSALNAITGTLDYGAYALARAAGRSPEQATKETTSPKDVIGRMTGVAGTPGYENAPLRRLGTSVGETVNENVVQPIANTTGLPEQDVANMFNTATMAVGPAIPKVAGATAQAVKPVANFGRGAIDVATGKVAAPGTEPTFLQQRSARIPATETYLPAEAQQQWRQGQISTPEAQQAFTKWTPQQIEQLQKTKGNVPLEGQVARAAGEQFMEPLTSWKGWLPELGGAVAGGLIGGGPVGAAVGAGLALGQKAYSAVQGARQINAMNQLGGMKFTPQTPAEQLALKSGAPHPVAGPIAPPTSTSLTVQSPGQQLPPNVMPMPGPQRNVNIEGQSYTLPNKIDVSNSQAASPKQISMNVAASKIQPAPQAPAPGPVQPQPLAPQVKTPNPTAQPTPKVEGMRSSSEIRKELDMIGRQSDELHSQGLEEGIKYGTPEGESYQAQLGQLNARTKVLEKELEAAVKAENSAAKKKAPSNVSQMLTEDTIFNTKAEWEKANMFNQLADKKRVGGYREGEHIVREEYMDYGDMPEDLRKHVPAISTVKRTVKGRMVR